MIPQCDSRYTAQYGGWLGMPTTFRCQLNAGHRAEHTDHYREGQGTGHSERIDVSWNDDQADA